MASDQIGSIELLEGAATVVHADGSSEALTANSPVLANDVITAGPDSKVVVRFANGSVYEIGAGETVALADVIEDEGSNMLSIDSGSAAEVAAGFVTNVVGHVVVIRDGKEVALEVGDFIFAGDVLKSADSSATFRMLDGTDVTLAPNSTADLGSPAFLGNYPDLADSLESDPASIYKAIIAGKDPSTDLSAPGAGEEAAENNQGHNTTPDLFQERSDSIVSAGHETDARGNTFSEPDSVLSLLEEVSVPIPVEDSGEPEGNDAASASVTVVSPVETGPDDSQSPSDEGGVETVTDTGGEVDTGTGDSGGGSSTNDGTDTSDGDNGGQTGNGNDVPVIAPVNGMLKNEYDPTSAGMTITGKLNVDPGTDGLAGISLFMEGLVDGAPILANDGTPLTSDGEAVLYRSVDGGFEGYIASGDTTIFTVTVNETDGTYNVELVGLLDGFPKQIAFDLGADMPGGNGGELFLLEPGVTYDVVTGEPFVSDGLVVWAQGSDIDSGDKPSLNSSAQGMGVGTANKIDDTETLRLNFTNASSWDQVGNDLVPNDDAPGAGMISYQEVAEVGIRFDHFGDGDAINWTLYASDGVTVVGAGTVTGTDGGSGANDTDISLVTGMTAGDYYFTNSAGGTVTLTVTDAIDSGFSIADFSGGNETTDFRVSGLSTYGNQAGVDLSLDITATVTDSNLDTDTAVFTVTFDGTGALTGDDAGNVIVGGNENDILVGLGGDDIMTGGGGADTFVWGEQDADGSEDVVTDFSAGADGDTLDLQAVLVGEENGDLADYLDFATDGADTVVTVNSSGNGEGDLTIRLDGVDLTDNGVGGTLSDTEIINNLLGDNNLITD